MDYRGGDIDLRTTARRGGADGDDLLPDQASVSRDGFDGAVARDAPIYVDDTLMSCCNHAFDVAVAHRSSEVRLEHLLYALTRIDAASEVLEAAGVRDAALRREAITVIASEIPIGLSNGTAKPRRSAAFEEALRLAAHHAYRRNRPASVADLLRVFQDVRPDLPGLDLLRRHAPTLRRDDEVETYRMPRPRFEAPSRPVTYDPPPANTIMEPARPIRYEPQQVVDDMQDARLMDLERMVRGLRDELSNERQQFSALLSDLKRDVGSQINASSSFSNFVQDRMNALEQSVVSSGSGDGGLMLRQVADRTSDRLAQTERAVAQRMDAMDRQFTALSDKLDTMQSRPASASVDTAPLARQIAGLSDKIDALENRQGPDDLELAGLARQLGAVTEKLSSLEKATGDGKLDIDILPILSRLDNVERALRSGDGANSETVSIVDERLKQFERLFNAQSTAPVSVDLGPVEGRLSDIETALLSRTDAGSADVGSIEARLGGLESLVSERFSAIQTSLSAERPTDGDTAMALQSEIKALAGAVATGNASQERFTSSLRSEIQSLARTDTAGDEQLRVQIVALKEQLAQGDQAEATGRADFVRELGEVHEALVNLHSNQQAISQSIDMWRNETNGSVNNVVSRLAAFEQNQSGPGEEIGELSRNLDQMYRITVERYHRRNRFWFWLFGTDDWIGASWPSQTARVEAELQAMKRSAAEVSEQQTLQ